MEENCCEFRFPFFSLCVCFSLAVSVCVWVALKQTEKTRIATHTHSHRQRRSSVVRLHKRDMFVRWRWLRQGDNALFFLHFLFVWCVGWMGKKKITEANAADKRDTARYNDDDDKKCDALKILILYYIWVHKGTRIPRAHTLFSISHIIHMLANGSFKHENTIILLSASWLCALCAVLDARVMLLADGFFLSFSSCFYWEKKKPEGWEWQQNAMRKVHDSGKLNVCASFTLAVCVCVLCVCDNNGAQIFHPTNHTHTQTHTTHMLHMHTAAHTECQSVPINFDSKLLPLKHNRNSLFIYIKSFSVTFMWDV